VTGVSWRAAQAYCEAQNKRLPTLVEWEYAAAASATARNATSDTAFVQWLITTYTTRPTTPRTVDEGVVNAYDVRGMHDLAWEWVADPNERFAMQSHHHHDHSAASGHDMSCAGAALGAGDPRNYPAFLRSAVRSALEETTTLSTLGFRCAA
jgi:formylglycine-generating enzyme required for sulfatase activity